MAGPTDLVKDTVLGSSARDNQESSFIAYMQSQGLEFGEYANEMKAAEEESAEADEKENLVNEELGIDIDKARKKRPPTAELDEKSKILEDVTTDNIKKIKNPRNQARHIDRTIDRAGDQVCDSVSKQIQAVINGDVSPKEFAKSLGGIGKNAMSSLMKDGLGAKDLKDLGKKAAIAGAAMVMDRAGVDDELTNLLKKIKSNKKKMNEIGNTKKAEDKVLNDVFKKLPPVVRQVLKGDKKALQRFIDQQCTQARRDMKTNALGRAGLAGKVKDFVDDK